MKKSFKYIILFTALLISCISMSAQTVVNGKYKGHRVTIRYYADSKNDYIEKFDYDGEDIDKNTSNLDVLKRLSNLEKIVYGKDK